jgi:long-chain acyl-CoA synthetase
MSENVPRNILPAALTGVPKRISDVVQLWSEKSPDQLAIVEDAGAWTYRDLSRRIAETQIWLLDLGVRPGDRVMIISDNSRAMVGLLMALASLDAWPVIVNPRLSVSEIDQIRNHCGARRVIYTMAASQNTIEFAQTHGAVVQGLLDTGQVAVGPLIETAMPEPIDASPEERVGALIYTSGTTGQPKGVMLTHRNLLFIAAVSAEIRKLTSADRLLGVLPMSHAVGLSVVLLGGLLSGATLYVSPQFDPMNARTLIEKHRITVLLGVPAMFNQWLQYAKLRKIESLKFPSLRIISSSGAPLDQAIKLETERLFGLVLHNGYGVTECSPTIAQTRPETPRADISVGRVLPGVEVQLVGADRNPVPDGEVGELRVRGPNVMKGYYRAPEETAAAIDAKGWFNTRDLARLEDEHLFIVGRTKELIVRFGFNVYPAEVEAVLNSHPAVRRSAVVGRSIKGDEQVVAFVELVPGSNCTTTELARHASTQLARYKQPSRIVLVPAMPVTPTGKVMKERLAKMTEQGAEQL